MVNFKSLITEEVKKNSDWNVVYEYGLETYFLTHKNCFDKHIHAPGIPGGGFWFHEHVKSEEGVHVLNYRTERNYDTAERISGYVKHLGISAPSEHLLELISQANQQLSQRKPRR